MKEIRRERVGIETDRDKIGTEDVRERLGRGGELGGVKSRDGDGGRRGS